MTIDALLEQAHGLIDDHCFEQAEELCEDIFESEKATKEQRREAERMLRQITRNRDAADRDF